MARRESPTEQEMGPKRYKDMIHQNSKTADEKNLPFTFPKKSKIKCTSSKYFECPKCGAGMSGTKFSYMIICSSCHELVKVGE